MKKYTFDAMVLVTVEVEAHDAEAASSLVLEILSDCRVHSTASYGHTFDGSPHGDPVLAATGDFEGST